jgi:alpha-glucan,water dikinase
VVDKLLSVQNKSYDKPTILVAKSVKGEEEIPDGVVGVITPDMPDVLSHVSVRARNCKVFFLYTIMLQVLIICVSCVDLT